MNFTTIISYIMWPRVQCPTNSLKVPKQLHYAAPLPRDSPKKLKVTKNLLILTIGYQTD